MDGALLISGKGRGVSRGIMAVGAHECDAFIRPTRLHRRKLVLSGRWRCKVDAGDEPYVVPKSPHRAAGDIQISVETYD